MKIPKIDLKNKKTQNIFGLIIILIIAAIGTKVLFAGHAQGPYTAKEAESGSLAYPSVLQTSNSASGGKFVQFCTEPINYPPPPVGGMTYVNWYFQQPDINTITDSIDINNDPGNTSDLYLQLYDANIDNTGQYFGLQTTGLAIFSQFGTTNSADNIITGPGSTAVFGTNEGPFISLRHDFGSLPVGHYTTVMTRTSTTGTGDWFSYYVYFPGQPQVYIGSILFPRANPSVPASFKDGGGSWTEFWDNNGTTLFPVPVWNVSVGATANGSFTPVHAITNYSAMPNSNINVLSVGGQVNFILGGTTPRCNPPGQIW